MRNSVETVTTQHTWRGRPDKLNRYHDRRATCKPLGVSLCLTTCSHVIVAHTSHGLSEQHTVTCITVHTVHVPILHCFQDLFIENGNFLYSVTP